MRIDVNLATRPWQDVRSFYQRWGVLAGSAALLAIFLWGLAIYRYNTTRELREQVQRAQAELKQLAEQRQQAEQVLARLENKPTTERSDFLNSLIARKAFSWTQVFTDLEGIMPPRVQVTALRPEITKENQLELRMQLSSPRRDAVLELVRRMEASERFRQARVRSESRKDRENLMEMEVSTLYVLPRDVVAKAAGTSGGSD